MQQSGSRQPSKGKGMALEHVGGQVLRGGSPSSQEVYTKSPGHQWSDVGPAVIEVVAEVVGAIVIIGDVSVGPFIIIGLEVDGLGVPGGFVFWGGSDGMGGTGSHSE